MSLNGINIHLYPSDFKHESRIEKITNTIDSLGIFDEIKLVGTTSVTDEVVSWKMSPTIAVELHHPANQNGSSASKVVRFFSWYKNVYKCYVNQDIKCVNVHGLSCLPLGSALARKTGAKLIYDTHELETESTQSKGLRKFCAKILERLFIKKSDAVFVVSEAIADHYANSYSIERPLVVLNSPPRRNRKKTTIFRDTFNIKEEARIFLYQGILSKGRSVHLLIDEFEKRTENNAVLVLMGFGPMVEDVKRAADANNNIFFQPAVTPKELLDYTASADVGLVFAENLCLSYDYSMPNKLFEYGMAGLPCVVTNLAEMKQYIETNQCGVVLADMSSVQFQSAINKLLESDLESMSQAAYDSAVANSWEVQVSVLEGKYSDLFL